MYSNQYINPSLGMNKYLPIAVLYFFLNSFMLPLGMLYTTLLTPVFLFWLLKYRSFHYIWYFFLFTVPFAFIHFLNGVETNYYLRSWALLFTAFVFAIAFYQFLKNCHTLRSLFRILLLLNFALMIFACIAFFIPSLKDKFWLTASISRYLESFPRLKMLTYEPSYYSTLLAPIVIYYCLKMIMGQLPNPRTYAVLVSVPLVLSFSLGILLGIPLAFFILFLYRLPKLVTKRKHRLWIMGGAALLVLALIFALIFFPDNPLFIRIVNLFRGHDTSFKGRTTDAVWLASRVAEQKSMIFGAGLGQTKVLGLELWRKYYQVDFTINDIAIPSAIGDTLAIYGIAGLVLRLGLQVYLFFRTKVYSNYYRFVLFIFIFIYQFTGSYIYNIAELAAWVLAFTNTFEEFDRKKASTGINRNP